MFTYISDLNDSIKWNLRMRFISWRHQVSIIGSRNDLHVARHNSICKSFERWDILSNF